MNSWFATREYSGRVHIGKQTRQPLKCDEQIQQIRTNVKRTKSATSQTKNAALTERMKGESEYFEVGVLKFLVIDYIIWKNNNFQ